MYKTGNIVLIGMPASGKSTVGVLLAKTLGIGFVDTDLLIQQREQRLLQEIIDRDGLTRFLDCERDAVLALDSQHSVIATGGSVVFRDDAMQKLKRTGVVIFLDVSLETIQERLDNIQTRGVAGAATQTIADIYYERLPLYRKYADATVALDGCSAEACVSEILLALKK